MLFLYYYYFPYEVKLDINDYSGLSLPSITFCLNRNHLWLKKEFQSMRNSFI